MRSEDGRLYLERFHHIKDNLAELFSALICYHGNVKPQLCDSQMTQGRTNSTNMLFFAMDKNEYLEIQ